MKICATCGCAKAFDDFHRDTAQKDGRHPYCKICKAAKVKARRDADPDLQIITATENHEKGRRLLDPTCAGGSHR